MGVEGKRKWDSRMDGFDDDDDDEHDDENVNWVGTG